MPVAGRHTAQTVARARRLRAGGWSYPRIAELVKRETGNPVHPNTVRIWCDDQARETHRRNDIRQKAKARARKTAGRLKANVRSPEQLLTRMRVLDEHGLSARSIAVLMRLDFDLQITEFGVRHALQTGRLQKRHHLPLLGIGARSTTGRAVPPFTPATGHAPDHAVSPTASASGSGPSPERAPATPEVAA
jgi:hypothetical protein